VSLPADRSVDAVLFDFGGVFTESPFAVAEKVGSDLGAEPGRLMEVVFGPYHDDTDHPWHRLERGELSLELAREEIIALGVEHGLDADPFNILALLAGSSGPRPELVDYVKRLHDTGYRTGIITNNAHEFRDAWKSMLPVDELFDVVVDSSEVGMRKPNPDIFRYALDALDGQTAERAVFLDDYHGNVEAAVELGMHGILVGPDVRGALVELAVLTAIAFP